MDKRRCAKCGKDLLDKGIEMEGVTDGDGMHPKCFVGFCKYLIERGARVPFLDPDIPLEEQKRIVDDPAFLDSLMSISILEPGMEHLDDRVEKIEPPPSLQ